MKPIFTPVVSNFRELVIKAFERQKFMAFIGATMETVEPGYSEIHVPYREELSQHHGFFHGGIIGTLADNVGGFAAYTLIEPENSMLSVEYKINFIAPAIGDKLIAKGSVIRHGRTLTVCQSEVLVVQNDTSTLCAISQMTCMKVKDRQ